MNVCVAVKDRDYGMALCESLMDWNNRFLPELMDAADAEGVDMSGRDLVIYDHDPAVMPENGVVLVDDPDEASPEDRRFFKYGNARLLGGELLFLYGRLTGRNVSPFAREDVGVYSVCGTVPGAGCTSAALALARELKRFRRKRVFYVSCDEIETAHEFMEPSGGRTSREFLYYLISGQENMCSCTENFICRDRYGIETLSPVRGRNPLLSLSETGLVRFIDFLTRCGRYDAVIIDIGSRLSEIAVGFMESSDRVIVVSSQENNRTAENWFLDEDDDDAACAEEEGPAASGQGTAAGIFETYLRETLDIAEDAVISVMNKCVTVPEKGLFLPMDEESFRVSSGMKDIAADGAFGSYISVLCREMTRRRSV
ncbi:MAG: hypothetical protein ACOYJH_05665 [Anaerovoracaceae bacterium]